MEEMEVEDERKKFPVWFQYFEWYCVKFATWHAKLPNSQTFCAH